jgi:hypothetical protein
MQLFHRSNGGASRVTEDGWFGGIETVSNLRFITVIIAFILAILALRKQPRWIGWAALLFCFIAGFVSMMILM